MRYGTAWYLLFFLVISFLLLPVVVADCTDSDEGAEQKYIFGMVTGEKTAYDSCMSSVMLNESICKDGNSGSWIAECQYGCIEGVCRYEHGNKERFNLRVTIGGEDRSAVSQNGSKGLNISLPGKIVVENPDISGDKKTYEDRCVGDNVVEYYIDADGYPANATIHCQKYCQRDVCVEGCDDNSDCDDHDLSTKDLCTTGTKVCAHMPIVECINGDGYCPEQCTWEKDLDCAVPHQCDEDRECGDGDISTKDVCVGEPRECLNILINECINGDGYCPPQCSYSVDDDCFECVADEQCDDGDPNTIDTCSDGCQHRIIGTAVDTSQPIVVKEKQGAIAKFFSWFVSLF